MKTGVWVTPTRAGVYEIACAELCGAQHYRMKGYLTVGTRDSLNSWLASQ
jgi:cytochrome c oxidase subunit II